MDIVLWIVAVGLMVVGVAGTVLPALPGMPLIFVGAWIAAAIGDYVHIGTTTLIVLGVLAAVGMAVDWVASAMGAQRAGATRAGLIGAAIGTVLGIFTGLWGLIFMPLVGAAIGEFIGHQDLLRAGKVGIATWLGMLAGAVIKIAIAFTMLGIVVVALLV
ncbi:MAG: DUF456 family protein [Burkholderiaceae bacterium]